MSEAFVIQRATPIALALAANLGRLARAGSAQFVGRSSAPGAAVVIGGGPSCGGFDRIPAGSLVLTVNTAAPRVCAEIAPHVLVIREVVSAVRELDSLRHAPHCIALDVQTAPATVARAHDVAPVLWAIPAGGHLGWLCKLLGQEPVYAGESAMNMAVALASRFGCDRQTLIGCDLAFGRGGEAYGDGTAWSGCRVDMSPDGTADFGDTREVMRENAARSAVPATLLREQTTPVLLEDGTAGHALATWVSQRAWVEQWAARHPAAQYANLSGGARIEGWPGATEALRGHPRYDVPAVAVDCGAIDAEVRRQLRAVREAVASDEPWRSSDALAGWPLVDLAAAKDVLEVTYKSLPLKAAIAERRPIMLRAADAIERAYETA
jgi:hypothetical protein